MLRVGVVGIGIRGKFFADAVRNNKHTKLCGICDVNAEVLQNAARMYEVPAYDDYREMIEKEKTDIVCVVTPDFAHKDVVVHAAEKGAHIFVEKPLATSTADCDVMERSVKANAVKLTVAYTNRWNPPFKRAKEIIDRGELGSILYINAKLNNAITIPTKMLSWAGQSSPAWFLTSHPLDLALWYTQKRVTEVYAKGIKKILPALGVDTWDYIHSIITFDDGTDAVLESCWVLPEGMPKVVNYKYSIVGSEAMIDLDMQDQMIHLTNKQRMSYPDTFAIELYGHMFAHNSVCFDSFVDSVLHETEPIVTLREARENVAVIEAIHRSLATGRPEIPVG